MLANDLATVYDEKGRYNKAIRLAEKAIRIATETSPEYLATYKYNLGHILMHKGNVKLKGVFLSFKYGAKSFFYFLRNIKKHYS